MSLWLVPRQKADKIEDGTMPALERAEAGVGGGVKGELLLSGAAPLHVITEHSHLGYFKPSEQLQKTRTKGKCFNKGARFF